MSLKRSGVSVQRGIADAVGQPAIGVSDNGGIDQLLLDPRTYAVIGIRELSTGVSPGAALLPIARPGVSRRGR